MRLDSQLQNDAQEVLGPDTSGQAPPDVPPIE
jgi:hypothetical protein